MGAATMIKCTPQSLESSALPNRLIFAYAFFVANVEKLENEIVHDVSFMENILIGSFGSDRMCL